MVLSGGGYRNRGIDEPATSSPKVGDLARVTVEGPVTEVFRSRDHGTVVSIGGYEYYPDFPGAHIVSVEVLLGPEPAWKPEDVVAVDYATRTETYGILPDGKAINLFPHGSKPFDLEGGFGRLWAEGRVRLIARDGKPVGGTQ